MIHVHLKNIIGSKHEENIQKFAEHFVQEIIEEALKRSSSNSYVNRHTEISHRFQSTNFKNSNSSSRSTIQLNHLMPSASVGFPKFSIDSHSSLKPKNSSCEDLYTLPVDTISKGRSKKTSSLEHKCLKPKAIRALNAIKSSHPRTLCDLKYFLLNLYSSNGTASKKIGSEHSAFTKYQCRGRSNRRRNVTQLESKICHSPRNDYQRVMKTGSSELHGTRRWKRCNFLDFKNSVCGVFKSHKKLADGSTLGESSFKPFKDRSLPPLPGSFKNYQNSTEEKNVEAPFNDENSAYDADVEFNYGNYAHGCMKRTKAFDFAASIEKVKDCGWYWGPMSSESAEKLLANEKDGSFIVRDSSDDRYIFSLTFKLNSSIMHVRIEHGQGNFSFGNYTNFKSHTIVEFIENTVQHSKSGRYLFFQYRHPIEGPMEVQLLYPVSRFKRVQSLQHMCRFVILKSVRRDLISSLPLPKPLIEYLNSKDYYAEEKF